MRRSRDRPRGIEFGVILLLTELFQMGYDTIPPVTLAAIIGQVVLYTGIIDVPWHKADVCISSKAILSGKDYRRLLLSVFEHGDDLHLYYNMISFAVKGRTLERKYGSKNFLLLVLFFCVSTSAMYVALGKVCAEYLNDYRYMESCAIGFSGVLFALKVLTTKDLPYNAVYFGISVPMHYAAWVELILIHLLVPNASFIGHLAGILVGTLYAYTWVGDFINALITTVTGEVIDEYPYYANGYPAPGYDNPGYYNAHNSNYRRRY